MSFTSGIKEEIARILDNARGCRLAELAAVALNTLEAEDGGMLVFCTEQEPVRNKLAMLLGKLYNIQSLSGDEKRICVEDDDGEIRDSLKIRDGVVSELLLKDSLSRRAYLRGMFLCTGSVSDPKKGYHLEMVCDRAETAEQVCMILKDFDVMPKLTDRKGKQLVYLKESEAISEVLNILGAHKALMELENLRIEKDLINDVNRRVNCDTANIRKMLAASERQLEDIRFLEKEGILKTLPEGLKVMAEVRLQYPELNLADLGKMMDPPIGKSGVNHRLRRLSGLAEERRNMGGKDHGKDSKGTE